MPKLPDKSVACKACGGTGKNSKGGLCEPCVQNGRVKFVERTLIKGKDVKI